MKELIRRGADTDVEIKGHSLLTFVAAWGSSEVLEYLLESKVVNVTDTKNDRTALSWAVCSEDALNKVILLLRYGADKNEKDADGKRAFDNICDRTYLGTTSDDKAKMAELLR